MLYFKYLKMHAQSSFEYKKNLFLVAISQGLISVGEIISVYLLFAKFESVGYWGFYETALMFGIITTVFAVVECFARGYDEFPKLIKNGELDRLLVRPVNIYYQIFCSKIEFSKALRIVLGIAISIIALCNLSVEWTFLKVAILLATFICGIVVILSIQFVSAGISIFTVDNLEFINIITNGSKELAFYPINIYNKWLTRFFTFIIPVACFNYLPINYIMGYGTLPMTLCALAPFLGMLFIIPCFLFFKWALTKYQGTGT